MEDVRLTGIESTLGYPLIGPSDLYRMPEPAMLIDGILPAQTITGLTSYPKVGKTWLVFEMMRAIITGGRFLDAFDARPGAALFVGSDASVFDYARQWRKLTRKAYDEHAAAQALDHEHENPFEWARFLIQSDFMFDNRDAILRLIQTIRSFEYGRPWFETFINPETGERETVEKIRSGFPLVVFDTLSKLTRANQNDNSEMENVFRNIRLIGEQTGAAIVILHHNSKKGEFNDGEDWRGAVAQIGALDNWFQLTPSKQDKDVIQFIIKAFRGITPEPFMFKRLVDEDQAIMVFDSAGEMDAKSYDDGIEEAAVAWLRSDETTDHWFTLDAICEGLYHRFTMQFPDRAKFKKALRNRLSNSLRRARPTVRRVGGGRRGSVVKYQATEEQTSATE